MAYVTEIEVERAQIPIRRKVEPERVRPLRLSTLLGGGLLLLGTAALVGLASQRRGKRRRVGRVGRVIGQAAGDLGRGYLAGTAGTLAITTASTTDQLVTEAVHARKEHRRPNLNLADAIVSPWSFSAGVVSKVFGITPTDAKHERRLAVITHWDYGSAWGMSLPILRAFGVRGVPAMLALLAGQLGAEMIVMPAFKLFPPPAEWGRRAVVSSVYQHAIYALAAVSAYEWLSSAARSR